MLCCMFSPPGYLGNASGHHDGDDDGDDDGGDGDCDGFSETGSPEVLEKLRSGHMMWGWPW